MAHIAQLVVQPGSLGSPCGLQLCIALQDIAGRRSCSWTCINERSNWGIVGNSSNGDSNCMSCFCSASMHSSYTANPYWHPLLSLESFQCIPFPHPTHPGASAPPKHSTGSLHRLSCSLHQLTPQAQPLLCQLRPLGLPQLGLLLQLSSSQGQGLSLTLQLRGPCRAAAALLLAQPASRKREGLAHGTVGGGIRQELHIIKKHLHNHKSCIQRRAKRQGKASGRGIVMQPLPLAVLQRWQGHATGRLTLSPQFPPPKQAPAPALLSPTQPAPCP